MSTAQTASPSPPPGPYFWVYRGQKIVRNHVADQVCFSVWRRRDGFGFDFDSFVSSMAAAMARIDAVISRNDQAPAAPAVTVISVGSSATLEGEVA